MGVIGGQESKKVSVDAPRPLLSLCMIARDNQRTIEAALATVVPWVDELIVVDTGSVDETPRIAEGFGARLGQFSWCDDFAAARNHSLDLATGRWVFWMDTDDTLPEHCGKGLRELLSSGPDDDVLGFVMQVHCPASRPGQDPIEPSRLSAATIVDHVKVFRNLPEIRFEGVIHEQVLPSIRQIGGRVEWTDLFVIHSGSDESPEGRHRKLERDLRLLRKDANLRPNHPFVLFNLGMTLLFAGRSAEAIEPLSKCLRVSNTGESHLRKAYALLVEALATVRHHENALLKCWEGLGRFPSDAELSFKLGRLLMAEGNWVDAIEAFERISSRPAQRYFSSFDPAITGYKMAANLAICFEAMGDLDQSLRHWASSIRDYPYQVDAWESIIGLTQQTGNYEYLKCLSEEFLGDRDLATQIQLCEALLAGKSNVEVGVARLELIRQENESLLLAKTYARYLTENGQWEKAILALRSLLNLEPRSPSHHFNLGYCLIQHGEPALALRSFHASLQLRPDHSLTHSLIKDCKSLLEAEQIGWDRLSAANEGHALLAVCFTSRQDPQRGRKWGESADLAFAIENWARGVCDSNQRAVVLYDQMPSNLLEVIRSDNVQFVHCPFESSLSANDFRFFAMRDYVRNRVDLSYICCLDLFDLIVNDSPFRLLPDVSFFVGSEETCYIENPWMKSHWQDVWGSPPPECLDEEKVLNAGIFGGERGRVLEFLNSMCEGIEHCRGRSAFVDMAVLNSLLYLDIGKDRFWCHGDPLHSKFGSFEHSRTDVAFIHK